VSATGDLTPEQALFRDVERLARDRGLGEPFEDWEPELARMREAEY